MKTGNMGRLAQLQILLPGPFTYKHCISRLFNPCKNTISCCVCSDKKQILTSWRWRLQPHLVWPKQVFQAESSTEAQSCQNINSKIKSKETNSCNIKKCNVLTYLWLVEMYFYNIYSSCSPVQLLRDKICDIMPAYSFCSSIQMLNCCLV